MYDPLYKSPDKNCYASRKSILSIAACNAIVKMGRRYFDELEKLNEKYSIVIKKCDTIDLK